MNKQVEPDHYNFENYMSLPRWNSIWYQLSEINRLKAKTVIEVGPGLGYFKVAASLMNIDIQTVDLDPALKPDHVADANDLPFDEDSFDVGCAFQVLEHMPFSIALGALSELARVARHYVVISLPDSQRTWRYLLHLPKFGERKISVKWPHLIKSNHEFDGEHYWELNKQNYGMKQVIASFLGLGCLSLNHTFTPFENPSHRFFIFSINKDWTGGGPR